MTFSDNNCPSAYINLSRWLSAERFQSVSNSFQNWFYEEGENKPQFQGLFSCDVIVFRWSAKSFGRNCFWQPIFERPLKETMTQAANLLRYIRSISKLPKFQSRGHFVLWPVCLLMHFPYFIDVSLSRHLASILSLGTLLTFFGSLRFRYFFVDPVDVP